MGPRKGSQLIAVVGLSSLGIVAAVVALGGVGERRSRPLGARTVRERRCVGHGWYACVRGWQCFILQGRPRIDLAIAGTRGRLTRARCTSGAANFECRKTQPAAVCAQDYQ